MVVKEVIGVKNKQKQNWRIKNLGKKQGETKCEKKGRLSSKNVFKNATKN
jgi:hypothetical protein